MIQERAIDNNNYPKIHAFITFFYTTFVNLKSGSVSYGRVRKWTKKIDIFDNDVILIPNHLKDHWTLTVVDFRYRRISYFDSMADGLINTSKGSWHMKNIPEYLHFEHQDKRNSPPPGEWIIGDPGIDGEEGSVGIPQQSNGSDCGVFVCQFAEYIARDAPLNFDPSQMPFIRKRMMHEICNGTLIDHVS